MELRKRSESPTRIAEAIRNGRKAGSFHTRPKSTRSLRAERHMWWGYKEEEDADHKWLPEASRFCGEPFETKFELCISPSRPSQKRLIPPFARVAAAMGGMRL